MSEKPSGDRAARRHEIECRRTAILEGEHLPSLVELLCGYPFHRGSLETDLDAWVHVTARAWRGRDDDVAIALMELHGTPSLATLDGIAWRLDDKLCGPNGDEVAEVIDRMGVYAAGLGDTDAVSRTARVAVRLAQDTTLPGEERADLARGAIGLFWLAGQHRLDLPQLGDPLFRSRLMEATAHVSAWTSYTASGPEPDSEEFDPLFPVQRRRRRSVPAFESEPTGPSLVVVREVGARHTELGQRIAEEMASILGKPVPLVPVPDLAATRAALTAEFPHLVHVVDAILGDLAGRDAVRIRPTLLLGSHGCGKTRFATRLLEVLEIPTAVYPCGGVSDSTIAGTARRWTSGESCLPLARAVATRTANVGIVLDELEKAGTSRHNGHLGDALLGMLEPRTAATWLDPYLQAPVDLSAVCWLATTNHRRCLSRPFLDRFRVLQVPEPGPEHLAALGNGLLREAVTERGLDPLWATHLDGAELAALGEVWADGSLRALGRLVRGVLAARDASCGLVH